MRNTLHLSAIAIIVLLFTACSPSRTVQRVSPDQAIDLSGRWNDTDSKQVAQALTNQVLTKRWIDDYTQETTKRPVVIIGLVRNKSHEHISSETFINDMEMAILDNGRVRLVQAGDKREELRAERADQQDFASPASMKKWGRELGADFILQGSINSLVDSYRDEKVVEYQVDLVLTNLETNELVWRGQEKLKKYINH